MDDEIPDAKCKEIYCEVCRHNIKKLGWAKHLKTKKHIENEKGVEEVEKKQCRKCGCWRVLELYRGENATCNVCLGYRESWAKKNEEKVRVMNKNYWDEHREEKREYNKEYSQREVDCEVCECRVRKCNWARHLVSRKHMLGGGGGKVDGDGGARGRIRRRVSIAHSLLFTISFSSYLYLQHLHCWPCCCWFHFLSRRPPTECPQTCDVPARSRTLRHSLCSQWVLALRWAQWSGWRRADP